MWHFSWELFWSVFAAVMVAVLIVAYFVGRAMQGNFNDVNRTLWEIQAKLDELKRK